MKIKNTQGLRIFLVTSGIFLIFLPNFDEVDVIGTAFLILGLVLFFKSTKKYLH